MWHAGRLHGATMRCPHLRVLPNLIAASLSYISLCYERTNQWVLQISASANEAGEVMFFGSVYVRVLCVYLSADLLNIRIRINPEIRFRIFDHFWSRQPKCKSHVQFAWGCNFFFMFSVFCQKQLNSLVHYPQINHNSQNSLTVI